MRKYILIAGIPLLFAGTLLVAGLFSRQDYCSGVIVQGNGKGGMGVFSFPEDSVKAKQMLKEKRKVLSRLQPSGLYIVMDTYGNRLYLRTADTVLLDAECSTGSGSTLIDSITAREWTFETPRGAFKVNSKLVEPWWRKPDWAFIEENETIPKNERERYDPNMMGDYAIGFGDGYFIHGTIYERLLGISVTHGCVRLGAGDLKKLYERVPIGTPVYIF